MTERDNGKINTNYEVLSMCIRYVRVGSLLESWRVFRKQIDNSVAKQLMLNISVSTHLLLLLCAVVVMQRESH
jgi:hypothetical protein